MKNSNRPGPTKEDIQRMIEDAVDPLISEWKPSEEEQLGRRFKETNERVRLTFMRICEQRATPWMSKEEVLNVVASLFRDELTKSFSREEVTLILSGLMAEAATRSLL